MVPINNQGTGIMKIRSVDIYIYPSMVRPMYIQLSSELLTNRSKDFTFDRWIQSSNKMWFLRRHDLSKLWPKTFYHFSLEVFIAVLLLTILQSIQNFIQSESRADIKDRFIPGLWIV